MSDDTAGAGELRPLVFYGTIPFDGRLDTAQYPAWSGATAYQAGQGVSRLGVGYLAKVDHTNQQPPNATWWVPQLSAFDPRTPATTYMTPADQFHIIPFLVAEPDPGVIWRLDTIWVTNISPSVCHVSIALANVGQTRGFSTAVALWGTALTPTTNFRFGGAYPAGKTEALDAGELLVRGRPSPGSPDGEGLWAAVSPGLNNLGAEPYGATVSFHGVVLA